MTARPDGLDPLTETLMIALHDLDCSDRCEPTYMVGFRRQAQRLLAQEAFGRFLEAVRDAERERIREAILELPTTRTKAWDRGWDSVSKDDAVNAVASADRCRSVLHLRYGSAACDLPVGHPGLHVQLVSNRSWTDGNAVASQERDEP